MGVVKGFPRRDEVWLVALDPGQGSENAEDAAVFGGIAGRGK
jgi:hypothetical protein